uniref:transcription-repair coupling factor n=1 Tax=Eubacterium cellulosolvens TaxID=29322 RepID=UPI00048180A6|nr:transcription-repair coupling factor [[Eubacterium] cellulosolvens]
MKKALMQPLAAVTGFEDLRKRIPAGEGFTEVSGCLDSQKAHIAAALALEAPAALLVAENERKARELYEDFRLFDPEVMYYPRRDLIFYQADISGNLLTRQRMQVIKALMEQKKVTVITCTGGCMDRLLPLRVLETYMLKMSLATEIPLAELAEKLTVMGYERVVQVECAGQFAIRGDIVDIYSLTEELPWRVEFWDDQVDSIRLFDPESQRSLENLDEITIYPATEEPGYDRDMPEKKAEAFFHSLTNTFPDYFPKGAVLFLDEPARLMDNAKAVSDEFIEAMKYRVEEKSIRPFETERMINEEVLAYHFGRRCVIALDLMEQHHLPFQVDHRLAVSARSVNSYNKQFPLLVKDLATWKKRGCRVVLLCASRTRGGRLAEDLRAEGLNAFFTEDEDRELSPGEIMVTRGSVRRGFEYPMQQFVLITESDIFGVEQRKKRKSSSSAKKGDRIRDFGELSIGDYVVHENHGLGVYRGIEKITVDHVVKDYVKIEYAGGGTLFVQATQLDVLQKYAGGEGHKPKLNSLGGTEWIKTKSKVRGAVRDIAKDLVALYAAREHAEGYRYGRDTVWQREFEELFPFEETEDQLQAIEDTKRDMESGKVMDRLVCGDVGYGKTEIAIRAAFKAVQENKQVVLLCPTTILAQQHFNTFTQRMKDYPVNIDMLSRFRSSYQQKKTIEAVRKGAVDILIGTHRVLSKDVTYKDLGLLIVDEEQRFGVTHKEKIKQIKKNVDVLTLTATPIPRTLHMSMIGIRDMSVLEEPPMDRLPIQTYVLEYDEEMIREALARELARDGQAFVVYNRVNGIAEMTDRIRRLLPDAVVEYAHGKMKETELESLMYRFINGEIDVLVATTIIETGMDISNVNTMVICDADRLGLSQLYQLRGRVGRSNRNSYAFLMYKKDKMLKEDAEKRLHAIREFTELGSGVKIAKRDLEIRGAGNLLGAEQSGHMGAVGYDLYAKMLGEAVREAKGIEPEADFETTIDLPVDAYLPASYIKNEHQKLEVYKRIAAIGDKDEADEMIDELLDRFGEPPLAAQNLIRVAQLKRMAHKVYISGMNLSGNDVTISMYERAAIRVEAIPDLLNMEKYRNRLDFRAAGKPHFLYRLKNPAERKSAELLSRMTEFCADMVNLL